ncbi:Pimeloyl-ACP methyl ester carboxylesterase [Streptomyces sp. 1222.5]|uniref:alpha/beta fold hydrolase n=1 Tax=unclassified Streptomyces TaxID=2593676 RepID=UPI000898EAE6|nr:MULTISPECIES: alpha/beta hydrolase [unclassified Streptomyces]PKW11567.1 pimeloyl-ACP methyl ester carboxylesterase [Streptomyces sp. 5112.2]SEB75570.1 Pimeloyl-ACP methyl ester carboxylesterase [Streptomyces sp. 1222.5]
MPYFESPVDGTRLHYVDHGPADGPVAVFVASAYLGHEMWEYQMLPLAEAGHRCVALDRRGHGRSDDTWSGYDLDTLADDLNGLFDHLDLRGITLVGHSVGTAEVIRCLTRHGSARVDRVALVAGVSPGLVRSPGIPDGVDPAAVRADEELFRRDRAAWFTAFADDFFAVRQPGNDVSPAYVRHLIDRCLVATPRAATGIRAVVATLDLTAELPALDVPVLVVHGTHDTSAPLALTGRRLAKFVPDATLKVYENGGHGLFATHADLLTADLREFLAAGRRTRDTVEAAAAR